MIYLLCAAAAAFAVWWLLHYMKGYRRRALLGVAEGAFVRLEDFGPSPKFLEATGLPFLVDGRACTARLMMEFPEEDGVKASYFDYSCLLGSGKDERCKQATLALFEFNKAMLPDFYLAAADETMAEDTGLEAADMAAFSGFPPGYRLLGRDLAALKNFFTPELASCFSEHPGFSAQGSGRYLLLYRACGLVAPKDYPGFMAEARKLAFNLS